VENVGESILASIKKALNIPSSVTVFDVDLIMHINTSLAKLCQLGVGGDTPFSIDGDSQTWDDFCSEPMSAMARTYVYLDVRITFDPPTASVLSALEKKKDELEWRLEVACDQLLHADDEDDQNEFE
jgi:hypothetical protein